MHSKAESKARRFEATLTHRGRRRAVQYHTLQDLALYLDKQGLRTARVVVMDKQADRCEVFTGTGGALMKAYGYE